jgi:hypothetical protein
MAAIVVAVVAATVGTAQAAPTIVAHKASNPLAWGLKSLQWTWFSVKTDSASAASWARVQVLSSKGVVATVYNGPLVLRAADAQGYRAFPAWNGKGADGAYLPTGNYAYRIQLTSGGVTTSASGPISVSRSRWTIDSRAGADYYTRYCYAGAADAYIQAWSDGDDSFQIGGFREDTGSSHFWSEQYDIGVDRPLRTVHERWGGGYSMNFMWEFTMVQRPGTVVILTVVQ